MKRLVVSVHAERKMERLMVDVDEFDERCLIRP